MIMDINNYLKIVDYCLITIVLFFGFFGTYLMTIGMMKKSMMWALNMLEEDEKIENNINENFNELEMTMHMLKKEREINE